MEVEVLRKEISDTGESKYKVVRLRADLQLLRDGQLVEGRGSKCQWRWGSGCEGHPLKAVWSHESSCTHTGCSYMFAT